MNKELSDEEVVFEMTKDGWFDDETGEPEVIIRLSRGSDLAPGLVPQATPWDPGAGSADAATPDPEQHRRVVHLSGVKPKQSMFKMPTLATPGHSTPRTETQPVINRFMYELPTLPTPLDYRFGNGTLQSRGTGPALESMLPDTMMNEGTMGGDVSAPVLRQNQRFGPRSGVRPRLFGHEMLTPIHDAPPPPTAGSPYSSYHTVRGVR